MQNSPLKALSFFSITAGIILFCTFFGGYTSFYRSQNRIEASKTALVESCQARLALLPILSDFLTHKIPGTPIDLSQEKLTPLLLAILDQKLPLGEQITKDLEVSQTSLTLQLNKIFTRFKDILDPETKKEFESLKQKLFKAQDNLYMAKDQYNYEILYFNMRTKSFPVSLIAKFFGFDKIIYYPFSEQAFLPARKAFEP